MIDTAEGTIGFDDALTQGEAFALRHALMDAEARKALSAFFTSQAEEAIRQCYQSMRQRPPQIEAAIGYAAQAEQAESSVNQIEEYVRKQIARS